MANPFLAEIRILPTNFAPIGWAFCDGQIMPISQNTALFSLLGTTYGGNGLSTFALPDFQGNAPIHVGGAQPGPGLSLYDLGEIGGTETVSLLQSEMPAHSHNLQAAGTSSTKSTPANNSLTRIGSGATPYKAAGSAQVLMSNNALAPTGGGLPHNNMQPYLTLNFCISLQGVFPQRS